MPKLRNNGKGQAEYLEYSEDDSSMTIGKIYFRHDPAQGDHDAVTIIKNLKSALPATMRVESLPAPEGKIIITLFSGSAPDLPALQNTVASLEYGPKNQAEWQPGRYDVILPRSISPQGIRSSIGAPGPKQK